MNLKDYLAASPPILMDGAFGSLLHLKKGGEVRPSFEWNTLDPELVSTMHAQYKKAGAQIMQSNTFALSSWAINHNWTTQQISKEIHLAANILKKIKGVFFAGNIGPCNTNLQKASDIYAQQLESFYEEELFLIIVETMQTQKEVEAFLKAYEKLKTDSSQLIMMANARTTAIQILSIIPESWILSLGFNCGNHPQIFLNLLEQFKSTKPIIVKPSRGIPQKNEKGELVYPISDKEWVLYVEKLIKFGAKLVGGCCGTTPETIKKLKDALTLPSP
ncbi:MAG: hypothetical protein A3G32_02400 [Deltaproteobacteria bacterium RIFCSPLOWO2_12_FULL_40_28]|nr:MAG: hypothetical protein A3C45_03080 [Deltaproteobacteria bacterium RIFCSPHIGHO2_02_FULL_40_28]OGQ20678.1 MAG: hypothetical protein A3E27_10190 [Deltaproteobacteria bacterium RIFCSPHIGHO2_12_FULL_40_32]OGQ38913.1 MAG: hypothetical protein A3I69_08410 [Deltaproteobacteria bacterium RIFCSPLOWO2_02_FULL_40_36]OGQ55273.1 MAG: hypothetical protein A3G32_02400 [Deltaproteobacteria bacterium RIFCSPLOWO2_12_FULL_40_28]